MAVGRPRWSLPMRLTAKLGPITLTATAVPGKSGGFRTRPNPLPVPATRGVSNGFSCQGLLRIRSSRFVRRAHQPGDFRKRRDLRPRAGTDFFPGLAVRRTRKPGGKTWGLLRIVHGGRVGNPVPGPGQQAPRLPQLMPTPGDEGLPVRRGQHAGIHLPLPRLELCR